MRNHRDPMLNPRDTDYVSALIQKIDTMPANDARGYSHSDDYARKFPVSFSRKVVYGLFQRNMRDTGDNYFSLAFALVEGISLEDKIPLSAVPHIRKLKMLSFSNDGISRAYDHSRGKK